MGQPKAQITTISNLPTTSMESALPPVASTNTLLAPQELFPTPSSSSLVARSELDPEQAQKSRQKHRRIKQAQRNHLTEMAELHGRGSKKGAKAEKEAALKGLVKSGKGVTVVGRGGKEQPPLRKRGAPPPAGPSVGGGKRFKL